MKLVIRREANRDLIALTKRLSPAAGAKLVARIQRVIDLLRTTPLIGSLLRDSHHGENYLRFMSVPGYRTILVVYVPTETSVDIVRIVSGRKDLETLLSEFN